MPGGGFSGGDLAVLANELSRRAPFLAPETARRWARSYGSRAFDILDGAGAAADLGDHFGAGLTSAEVAYLRREEWAVTAEDILWRRSKLGLHLSQAEVERLTEFVKTGSPGRKARHA